MQLMALVGENVPAGQVRQAVARLALSAWVPLWHSVHAKLLVVLAMVPAAQLVHCRCESVVQLVEIEVPVAQLAHVVQAMLTEAEHGVVLY